MITGLLHYLSHPEVDIDPAVPVPDWRLNRRGLARVTALAARGWPWGVSRVISSAERKARETAAILASALGVSPEARHAQNEIDRSATGYVPHDRHEALAGQFFDSALRKMTGAFIERADVLYGAGGSSSSSA